MERLLVIDDNPDQLRAMVAVLRAKDYDVATAPSGASGIEALENDDYDLVLTDLMMPDVDGMDVLAHVVSRSLRTKCIIVTGHGSIRSTVEAMKHGACDYIPKPIIPTELLVTVDKALHYRQLEEENVRLKRELRRGNYMRESIIGTSKPIQDIFKMIEKVADTDSTILITGDSGTGKELIAKAIHFQSGRSDKPMVVINCGAIPEALLESELFGHEKGAFTGAHKSRTGRFEMANGGTVFLDEIGEMSPQLQVKLLRILQDQRFERVGGTKTIHVDVRIIAATHKNLTTAINDGSFREDLYYRLNVINIKVPSLRQRSEDIPLLVNHFLQEFQEGKENRVDGLAPEAMSAMLAYRWPGNVRELENVIKTITILCESDIAQLEDLPEHIQQDSLSFQQPDTGILEGEGQSLDRAVKDYEKRLILDALEKCNGVRTRAAKLLRIKRTTLVEKIKKQNIAKTASA